MAVKKWKDMSADEREAARKAEKERRLRNGQNIRKRGDKNVPKDAGAVDVLKGVGRGLAQIVGATVDEKTGELDGWSPVDILKGVTRSVTNLGRGIYTGTKTDFADTDRQTGWFGAKEDAPSDNAPAPLPRPKTVTKEEKEAAADKVREAVNANPAPSSTAPAGNGPTAGSGQKVEEKGNKATTTPPKVSMTILKGTPTLTVDGQVVDPTDTVDVNRAKGYKSEAHAAHVRNYFAQRRQEEIQAIRDRAEEGRKERAATKAKYDKENYDKAKFSTREGWANLGLRDGEKSGASFAEGSEERKAYDERVARIREGLKGAGESYRSGYISGGGNIAGISKVFEEGASAGTLSNKQLEALEKRIGSWSRTAADKKAFMDRELAVRNEESARRYLGDAAKGLGGQAAIALADGQRLAAVQGAAKGLSDATISDADRLKHSETLLRHGVDAEAIGRNLVEMDAKVRGRFVKDAGGNNDADTFRNLYRTYGLESIGSAKSFGDITGNLQTGTNGVGIRTPAVAKFRQDQMVKENEERDQKMDQALETLKPKPNAVETAINQPISDALDAVKGLFGGSDAKELQPKETPQPATSEEIDDELGVSAARRGGFARRYLTPTVLEPRG